MSPPTPTTNAVHPYRAAWETRDLDVWIEALAGDVVLVSPIIRKPFHGRDPARQLFEILFGAFSDFRITHEFNEGAVSAFYWTGDLKGRSIEGSDLITSDEDGRVTEIRVLVRPLVNIATFAAAIGPPMARRRGRLRGAIAKVLSMPLRPLLIAVDFAATRLSQSR